METSQVRNNTNNQLGIIELDESSPVCEHPTNIKVQLKAHQLAMLEQCNRFEQHPISMPFENSQIKTKIGIIGDKVGSGKSYVILSMIKDVTPFNEEISIRTYAQNNIIVTQPETSTYIKTNVLVIPHNLSSQWKEYIVKFGHPFKYILIDRCTDIDKMIAAGVSSYDLIITTCTHFNRIANIFKQNSMKVRRTFFDEVDSMNIPSCEPIDSCFIWFVTASYGNLIHPRGNNTYDSTSNKYIVSASGLRNGGFIKNIFNDLYAADKPYINMLIVKNKESFIAQSFHLPEIVHHYIRSRTPPSINILHGIADNHIIASLNAGDIEGAIEFIAPGNKGSEDNIVSHIIDKYERILRNDRAKMQYIINYEYQNEADRQIEMGRVQERITLTENKINNIKRRIKESNTCSICFDDVMNKTIVNCCSNAYCFKCINLWFARNRSCPLCKTILSKDDLYVVSATSQINTIPQINRTQELHDSNDKIQNLKNILRKINASNTNNKTKVLIFSAYDTAFTQIIGSLYEMRINHSLLKGNSHVVRSIVDGYKEGNINVLLVNTKNYGSGLNLENTTDIIMFHKFDTEIEKQVIGRAQRYGRKDNLRIWYLLHDNEMNEAATQSYESMVSQNTASGSTA